MPTIPCCSKVVCPGGAATNLDYDFPIRNLSSEAPDQDLFIGLNTGWDYNVPGLGSNWTAKDCLGICTSPVSQQAADDCAAIANLQCVSPTWGVPPGTGFTGGPSGPNQTPFIPGPMGNPPQLFFNQSQACSSTCPDGSLFTFAVPFGTFIATSQLLANEMAFSRACRLAATDIICLGPMASEACLGQPYNGSIFISGGLAPFSFQVIAGSLPPGFQFAQSMDQRTIFVSGTPASTAPFSFTLLVTDARGNFMQKVFNVSVVFIANTLPPFSNNVAYTGALAVVGGTAPYSFAIVSGTLPNGLSMDQFGNITGTPTLATTQTFTVAITDATGFVCNQSVTLSSIKCGPDWTTISWAVQIFNDAPTSTFSGDHFSVAASGVSSVGAGSPSNAVATGTINYKGPAFNGNFHLVMAGNTVGNFSDTTVGASMQAPGLVLNTAASNLPTILFPNGPGTYDVPFTVPDTGGATVLITITISWQAGVPFAGFGGPVSMTGSGKFTSVC